MSKRADKFDDLYYGDFPPTTMIQARVPKTLQCPKCGPVEDRVEWLTLQGVPHSGPYCLRCFGAWVEATIPKLESVTPPNELVNLNKKGLGL